MFFTTRPLRSKIEIVVFSFKPVGMLMLSSALAAAKTSEAVFFVVTSSIPRTFCVWKVRKKRLL